MGYTIDDMNKIAYKNCMKEKRLNVVVPLYADSIMEEMFEKIESEAIKLKDEGMIPKEKTLVDKSGLIEVSCTELSKLTNLEFVNQCYRIILGREAESRGKENWLIRLNTGLTSKIEMIYDMAESEEGKRRNIVIVDGRKKIKVRRLYRKLCGIPILGRFVSVFRKAFGIYKTLWNIQYQLSLEELRRENMEFVIGERTDFLWQLSRRVNEVEEELLFMQYEMDILRQDSAKGANVLEEKIMAHIKDLRDQILQEDLKIEDIIEQNKKENAYECIEYFDFENHFRGDRERIKEIQKLYLPYYIDAKGVVLDIGCGRGEFLENLRDNGIDAIGIDSYSKFVEYDKSLGLKVIEGNAIEYLRECHKVGGIFAGQLIEHLKLGEVIELCSLAYEKLEKGAYLIMETPNPTSLDIFTESFYIDPSHNKPVHPQTIKYLLEKAGFKQIDFLFTVNSRMPFRIPLIEQGENVEEYNRAIERANEMLFGSQDYAVVAKR